MKFTRRTAIGSAIFSLAGVATDAAETRAWDFTFPSIDGGVLNLADYRGRVLLVVNTASFCGFTYQYEALEKLHAEMTQRGLTVIGVPSQDFYQEKGSNEAVKSFCELTYGVQFPMAGISRVRGSKAHPFYQWVRAQQDWQPSWNFNKVLVARDGTIAGHYGSSDEPTGKTLTAAIDRQLAAIA